MLAATALHNLLAQQLEAAEQAIQDHAKQLEAAQAPAPAAKPSVLNLLKLTRGRQTGAKDGAAPGGGAAAGGALTSPRNRPSPAGAAAGASGQAGNAGGRGKGVLSPMSRQLRPRRLSQPLPSRAVDSNDGRHALLLAPGARSRLSKETDAFALGAEASLLARLRQNVQARRIPKERLCTGQDLLRMGVTIPDNVER